MQTAVANRAAIVTEIEALLANFIGDLLLGRKSVTRSRNLAGSQLSSSHFLSVHLVVSSADAAGSVRPACFSVIFSRACCIFFIIAGCRAHSICFSSGAP